jgi:uncharacterized protein YbaP (TraB family)
MVSDGTDDPMTAMPRQCQRRVSMVRNAGAMVEDEVDAVIRRAIGGDPIAVAAVLAAGEESNDARLVVLAALLASRLDWMARAEQMAVTTRDRQIVAVGRSHLMGDRGRVDSLARDHLADHPGSFLVAWVAGGAGD